MFKIRATLHGNHSDEENFGKVVVNDYNGQNRNIRKIAHEYEQWGPRAGEDDSRSKTVFVIIWVSKLKLFLNVLGIRTEPGPVDMRKIRDRRIVSDTWD